MMTSTEVLTNPANGEIYQSFMKARGKSLDYGVHVINPFNPAPRSYPGMSEFSYNYGKPGPYQDLRQSTDEYLKLPDASWGTIVPTEDQPLIKKAVFDTLYAYKKLEKEDKGAAESALKYGVAKGYDLIGGMIQRERLPIDGGDEVDPFKDVSDPWRNDDAKHLLNYLPADQRTRALHTVRYLAENLDRIPGVSESFQVKLDVTGALTGYLVQLNRENFEMEDKLLMVTSRHNESGVNLNGYDMYAMEYVFGMLNRYGHTDVTKYLTAQKATIDHIRELRVPDQYVDNVDNFITRIQKKFFPKI